MYCVGLTGGIGCGKSRAADMFAELETASYHEVIDRVLVVDCDEARQVERTIARSALSKDDVRRIMGTQVARGDRLRAADDVLSNDDDIETLRARVSALHQQYLAAAEAAREAA